MPPELTCRSAVWATSGLTFCTMVAIITTTHTFGMAPRLCHFPYRPSSNIHPPILLLSRCIVAPRPNGDSVQDLFAHPHGWPWRLRPRYLALKPPPVRPTTSRLLASCRQLGYHAHPRCHAWSVAQQRLQEPLLARQRVSRSRLVLGDVGGKLQSSVSETEGLTAGRCRMLMCMLA